MNHEFSQSKSFSLADRMNLHKVLHELELSETGITENNMSRVGKLANISYFLSGKVVIDNNSRMTLYTYFTDATTAEIKLSRNFNIMNFEKTYEMARMVKETYESEYFYNSNNLQHMWTRAIKLFNEEKYSECIDLCKNISQKNPINFKSLLKIADCYKKQGNYKSAIKYWEKAILSIENILITIHDKSSSDYKYYEGPYKYAKEMIQLHKKYASEKPDGADE